MLSDTTHVLERGVVRCRVGSSRTCGRSAKEQGKDIPLLARDTDNDSARTLVGNKAKAQRAMNVRGRVTD